MRSIASKVLNWVLGDYIEPVTKDNVDVGLWSGGVGLNDIVLKEKALMNAGLPVKIHQAIMHKLSAKFPWKSLKSKSTEAEVDQLFILGSIVGSVTLEKDKHPKKATESDINALCVKDTNNQSSNMMNGIVGTIVDNLKVNVTNIHIRIELNTCGKTVAFGVIIPSVYAYTVNKNGLPIFSTNHPQVLYKKLVVQGLSIYLDTNSELIDTNDFVNNMSRSMSSSHQYILENFSFDAIWEYTDKSNTLFAQIDFLKIALDRFQWIGIDQLQWQNYLFNQKRLYADLGRPEDIEENSEQEWWHYCHKASLRKVRKHSFKPFQALVFLKRRKECKTFLDEYVSTPVNKPLTKQLRGKLRKYGEDNVFRAAEVARFFLDRKIESKNEVTEQKVTDTEVPINKLDAIIHSISVSLRIDPDNELLGLNVNNVRALATIHGPLLDADLSIGDLRAIDKTTPTQPSVISLVTNLAKPCIQAKYSSNTLQKKNIITSHVVSPNIFADVPYFMRVASFFSKAEMGIFKDAVKPGAKIVDSTRAQAQRVLLSRGFNYIDLEVESPKITVPFRTPAKVEFGDIKVSMRPCENRSIDDKETWYDSASVDIASIGVLLGDDYIIKPFATQLGCKLLSVPMASLAGTVLYATVKAVEVDLKRSQFLELLALASAVGAPPLPLPQPKDVFEDIRLGKPLRQPKPIPNPNGLSMGAGVLLERLTVNLKEENDEILDNLIIDNTVVKLMSIDGKMDITCDVFDIVAKEFGETEFLHLGADSGKAIECSIAQENDNTDIGVQIESPFFLLNFDWVFALTSFFEMPKLEKRKKEAVFQECGKEIEQIESKNAEKPKEEEKKSSMNIRAVVMSPKVGVAVPGKKGTVTMNVDVGKIGAGVSFAESQLVKADVTDFTLSIDGRTIIKPMGVDVAMEMQPQSKLKVVVPDVGLDVDTSDYLFLMDLLEFLPAQLSLIGNSDTDVVEEVKEVKEIEEVEKVEEVKEVKEDKEKKEEKGGGMDMDILVKNVSLDLTSEQKDILGFKVSDITVTTPGGVMTVGIANVDGFEHVTHISEDFLNVTDLTVELGKTMSIGLGDIKFAGKTPPVLWAIEFFTSPHEQTIDFVRRPKVAGEPSDSAMRVSLRSVEVGIIRNDGITLGTLSTGDIGFAMASSKGKSEMDITVRQPRLLADSIQPFPYFLDSSSEAVITIKMKPAHYEVRVPELLLGFHMPLLNEILKWSGGFSKPSGEWKDSPSQLAPATYDVEVQSVRCRLLPYFIEEGSESLGADVVLKSIMVKTPEFPKKLLAEVGELSVFSLETKPFLKIEKISVPIELGLTKECPNVKEGFDPSVREEFVDKDLTFFTSLKVNPTIGSIAVNFDKKQAFDVCTSATQFTFSPPPAEGSPEAEALKHPPIKHISAFEEMKMTVGALINEIAVKFDDRGEFARILLKKLRYSMTEKEQSVKFLSLEVGSGIEDELEVVGIVGRNLNAFDLRMKDGKTKIDVRKIDVFLDYLLVPRLYKHVMTSAFLTYNLFPYPKPKVEIEIDPKEEETKQGSELSVKVGPTHVAIPVDPEKDDVLVIDLQAEFEQSPSRMYAHAINLCVKFAADAYDHPGFTPIINHFDAEYETTSDEKIKRMNLDTSLLRIGVSPVDIAAFSVLGSSIGSLAKHFVSHSSTYKEPSTEVDPRGTQYNIGTGKVIIDVVADNRISSAVTPLLRVDIDPLIVGFDTSIGTKASFTTGTFSISHYNQRTLSFDQIIEPIRLNVSTVFGAKSSKIRVDMPTALNINVTHRALRENIELTKTITKAINEKKISTNEKLSFKFHNKLGVTAHITLPNTNAEVRANETFATDPIDPTTPIKVTALATDFKVAIQDITYPQFIYKNVVASVFPTPSMKMLIFSTTIRFRNKTKTGLILCVHSTRTNRYKTVELRPGGLSGLPMDVPNTARLGLMTPDFDSMSYNLFTVSDVKKKEAFVYKIGSKEKMNVVVSSSSEKKSSTYFVIDISPQIVIQNSLMHTVSFQIEKNDNVQHINETLVVKPGQQMFSKIATNALTKLTGCVKIGDNPYSGRFEIPPVSKKIPVPVTFLENSSRITICVETIYDEMTKGFTIDISVPAIVFNESGFDLMLASSNTMAAAIFGTHKGNQFAYWGTEEFFASGGRSQSVQILANNEWRLSENPLQCMAKGLDQTYFIPTISSDRMFLPIHYKIEGNVVTLQSQIKIENRLREDIWLEPIETLDSTEKPKARFVVKWGETKALDITYESFAFIFSTPSALKGVPISLEMPVNVTVMLQTALGRKAVEIEVLGSGTDFIGIIKPATVSQPLTITNDLDIPIAYSQIECQQQVEVLPHYTSLVMLERPFAQPDVILFVDGVSVQVIQSDLERPTEYQTENGSFFVTISIHTNGSKTINVTPTAGTARPKYGMDFRFVCSDINVAVIDSKVRELCVLNVHNIGLSLVKNDRFTNISFSINQLELDDMAPVAPLDVVVVGAAEDGHHFVEARMSMFADAPLFTAFSTISLRLQPLRMFIDLGFVSDVLSFVNSLSFDNDNKTKPEPSPAKTRAYFASSAMTAQTLRIHEIALNFSIFTETNRSMLNPMVAKVLSFVPSVNDGSIDLPSNVVNDFTGTSSFINERIISPYIDSVKTQALRLLFNTSLLFGLSGITDNLSKQTSKIADGEITAVGGATIGTVLTAGEGVLRTTSNLLHAVTGNKRKRAVTVNMTAQEAMQSSFDSVYGAVGSNALMNGISENRDGMFGAVAGIGSGIGQMVISPLAGILDASTSLLAGARKFVNDETLVFKRRRIPRCFGNEAVGGFKAFESKAQHMLMVEHPGEGVGMIVADCDTQGRYVIVTRSLIVVVHEGDPPVLTPPLPIVAARPLVDGTSIAIMFDGTEGILKFRVNNERTVNRLLAMVMSHKNELTLTE